MADLLLFDNDELFVFARADMAQEKYQEALLKVKLIMSRGSFAIEVFALAGKIYASVGLYEKAKAALNQFVKEVPDAYVELFQLGMVEHDMGDIQQAKGIWNQVLELSENYPPALYHLGVVAMDEGQLEDAKDYLNKILETAPDDSEYIGHADQLLTRLSLQ